MRRAVFSGSFYPDKERDLFRDLGALIPEVPEEFKTKALGILSPHAGYIFSGETAGKVYGSIKGAGTYLILGPNHSGDGPAVCLSTESWKTPLGIVETDPDLSRYILEKCPLLEQNNAAHKNEHSIEVQLPFIQKISPSSRIVAITVKHAGLNDIRDIGSAIALAIKETSTDVCIVASTDMSHYEPRAVSRIKDREAIETILRLDAQGLINAVQSSGISMCGYIPAAIMLVAVKNLGAEKGTLVKYTDSGESTGVFTEVVGYAGIVVR